jgi:starch-binding outer membrane protein, SusD/RagB family
MKAENIKYLVLLPLAGFLWSCKKELNVYPTTSEVDGDVIVSTQTAATVLNGVYYRFADAGTNNSSPTIFWTDINEIIPSEFSGALVNSGGDDNFYSFTLTPQTSNVDAIWNYGYNIINAANGFIKNIDPVTTIPLATKTEMVAEAKFLRAFGNTELLLYYGQYYDTSSKYGIILRDEFVTADNINLPRSGVAAVYAAILADLDTAIADLPASNTQTTAANAWTAKLLKARLLINRGTAGDYEQVIALTADIIANSPFQLEDSVKDIFLSKGFSSNEVILGVQPFATQNYKFQDNQEYNEYVMSDSFVNLLQNDPRSQWLYKPDTTYLGPIYTLTKYYSGDPVNLVQTPLSEYCYAFRLTEAYLLEAEAIALSNGDLTTAKTLLETIEAHAGISDFTPIGNANTASALQLLIVKEELKNFAFENGADWFALRRLPFQTIQTLQPAIQRVNQLILPIPYTELSANIDAFQNPGF